MKRFLTLFFAIFVSLSAALAGDTIWLNSTNKVSFNIGKSVEFYFYGCTRRTASATTTTTATSISGLGKLLLKKDGTGFIQPLSTFKNGSIKCYSQNCGFQPFDVVFATKSTLPPPNPDPTPDPTPDPIPDPTLPKGQFTISVTSSVSAGVYQNGKLIKTLFNSKTYPAGTHSITWDGKLDNGSTITGKYQIKAVTSSLAPKWYGNIGNSSSAPSGPTKHRGLRSFWDIIEFNGYVYYCTGLTEGETSCKKASLSDLGKAIPVLPAQNGDINLEEHYLATDGKLVYHTGIDPYKSSMSFIYATDINDTEYRFASGQSVKTTYGRTYPSVIDVQSGDRAKGMAVGSYLYVSHSSNILIYEKSTGAKVGSYSGSFGDLSIDGNYLYAVSGSNSGQITKFIIGSNGSLSVESTLNGGPYISVKNGQVVSYSGEEDFNDFKVRGAVSHGSNGIWYTYPGSCRAIRMNSGVENASIAFIPMNYSMSCDRNNPTRVFAGFVEYQIDYTDKSWRFVKNWSSQFSSSYKKSNSDIRKVFNSVITVSGRTYAFVDNYSGGTTTPQVVELTSSGVKFLQKMDEWAKVQFDLNGDIIWLDGMTFKRSKYNASTGTWSSFVNEFNIDNSIGTDVGFSETYAVYNKNKEHSGYHLGKASPSGFLYKCSPSVNGTANGVYPSDGSFDIGSHVEYAGWSNSSCDSFDHWNYVGEFWGCNEGQVNKHHIWWNGLQVMQFGVTYCDPGVAGTTAPAMMSGNAFAIQFVKYNNKYYILHCDESFQAAIHLWELDIRSTTKFYSWSY